MQDTKIAIGKIFAPHGLKGAVKIRSLAEPAESILQLKLIFKDDSEVRIKKIGICKEGFICIVNEVKDRNSADLLIGRELFVKRIDLPIADDEEFYITDLVGSKVFTNKNEIGEVIAVHNFGADDILEIKHLDGKTELYPFNKEFFPNIDIDNKKIELSIWESN